METTFIVEKDELDNSYVIYKEVFRGSIAKCKKEITTFVGADCLAYNKEKGFFRVNGVNFVMETIKDKFRISQMVI